MYKILDLFAGAGGLSLGFEMTKQFDVCAIVENNPNAAKTYIENHPGLKNYNDILKVDFRNILKENGTIDVVIGGPPCQGFSNANRQRRQLINGSNELVKRYVKAIEEIQPKVFVMENVNTISSDKHSFCLTNEDEDYIRNQLNLEIHDKDVVLYEGEHVNDINELCQSRSITELCLISEENLYVLYNIYKKRTQLKKYFSKSVNVKKVLSIIECMEVKDDLPNWYNNCALSAKTLLMKLIEEKNSIEDSLKDVKRFWDVQRFFQALLELESKDAIYSLVTSNKSITVRMSTYIVIDYVKNAFRHLQYQVRGEVLNAASFGVPQTRERYILIGVKEDILGDREIELPKPLIEDPADYVSVRTAIGDLEKYIPTTGGMDAIQTREEHTIANSFFQKIVFTEGEKQIFNHVCTETRETALKRFEMIQQGKNFHSLPDDLKSTYENPERTQNTIYKRLTYDFPSDTVVNVRKSMWIHPVYNRAVSAREAARLQGFPDYYKFLGTKDSVYQQIGNAVPPFLGRAVAEKVLQLLNNEDEYISLKALYEK
jgi:DNA (cytosine-5)-methyltransferase 1